MLCKIFISDQIAYCKLHFLKFIMFNYIIVKNLIIHIVVLINSFMHSHNPAR